MLIVVLKTLRPFEVMITERVTIPMFGLRVYVGLCNAILKYLVKIRTQPQ